MKRFYIYDHIQSSNNECCIGNYSSFVWLHAAEEDINFLRNLYATSFAEDSVTKDTVLLDLLTYLMNNKNNVAFRIYLYDINYINFLATYTKVFNCKDEATFKELYSALNEVYDCYSLETIKTLISGSDGDIRKKLYEDLVNIFSAKDDEYNRYLSMVSKGIILEDYITEGEFNPVDSILNLQLLSYSQFFTHLSETNNNDIVYSFNPSDALINFAKSKSVFIEAKLDEDINLFLKNATDTIIDNLCKGLSSNISEKTDFSLFKAIWQAIFVTESVCALPPKAYTKVCEIIDL